MARKKADDNKVEVGNISDVSGEVTIAGGDIYKGFTAEQVSVLITQLTTTFEPKKFDGRSPYKGLDVFDEEDAELFFGREKLVDDLVNRVKDSRSVFVTGPSGSGKSSLVRAGLIHALKNGAAKELHSERWLYATMKPGRDPIGELARVTAGLASSTNAEDEVRAKALTDVTIFARWCEIALKEGRYKRAALFIDQFEEVFTQISRDAERIAFLNLLTHAATVENGRVIILFSMRSDFVSSCATYPQLNDLLNQQFMQIGAMQPDELVSAIAQPALRVGLRIDPDLIAQIINEMKGEPGALPLMQFALKDLFDSRQAQGGVIALTLNDYLKRGGVHKALERHADASFAKLDKNEQELARSIFSGLIEIGRGTQDTSRTALFNELIPVDRNAMEVEAVVHKLADARLITTDEQAGKDTVTISHEKLIDAWPWLKKLVSENRDVIALQNEIASDANEWDEHQRDTSYLYTGARLANAREKLELKKVMLGKLAQLFIETGAKVFSDDLEAAKQRAIQLRQRSVYLTAALVASLIAVCIAILFGIQSRKQTRIALARQMAAQAQFMMTAKNSKQMIAVLLAVESMTLLPSSEAAQVLLSDNLSAHLVAHVIHDNRVGAVALSPDGMYALSGGADNIARMWEVSTGKEISHMVHEHWVESVAFSSNGKFAISGSYDGTIRIWETDTGKEISRLTPGGLFSISPDGKLLASGNIIWEIPTGKEVARTSYFGQILSLAFSPDGKLLVTGNDDLTARVWETATGKEISRMTHEGTVYDVNFSPDGKFVISGSRDNTARVWDAVTGKELARMIHDAPVSAVAFSPDGKYVVSGSWDETARVWDMATGQEISRIAHSDKITAVSYSPDGKYIVSGSDDFTARMWEATTGLEVARVTHAASVTVLAFSRDGKHVITGSNDGTVLVWEASTVQGVTLLANDGNVSSVAFSPNGKYIVSGSDDNTARVWEISTGKQIINMPHGDKVYTVAFSPDGKYVASGSADKNVRIWDVSNGNEIVYMIHTDAVTSVAFSPNGKYLASGSRDNTVRVWDITSGREVARMLHDDSVTFVTFSPDSKYVISGSEDNTARVWDALTGKEISRKAHSNDVPELLFTPGYISSIAISPNGKYIISGSDDRFAYVWTSANGQTIASRFYNDVVSSVAFSPDGRHVASGSFDHTAHIWDAFASRMGRETAHFTHDGKVLSIAFSPDGKYVISGSDDNTARIWDAFSGREIARLTHDAPVRFVAFSPDGKYAVSGGNDPLIRVWRWQPDDLISNACSHLSRNMTRSEWDQYIGNTLAYEAICPNLVQKSSIFSYFIWMSLWPIISYIFYSLIVYRAILSKFRPSSGALSTGFTLRRFLISVSQGIGIIIMSSAGLLIIPILNGHNIVSFWNAVNTVSIEFSPSLNVLFLLLPSTAWAGGVYSHLTRFQSVRSSPLNRIFIGGVAGSVSTFLACCIILLLTVSGILFAFGKLIGIALTILIPTTLGCLGGFMSAIGSVIYIYGLQRRALKSFIPEQISRKH